MKLYLWVVGLIFANIGSILWISNMQGTAMLAFTMAIGFWIWGASEHITEHITDAIKKNLNN